MKMFKNIPVYEKSACDKEDFIEELEYKPVLLSIPKIEPLFSNMSYVNEDTINVDKLTIPFTTPYKVKDPIILLERCDKIWETLKMTKKVKDGKNTNMCNALSLEMQTTAKSTNILNDNKYIEYQPVLCNSNAGSLNFKLSVKNKKKVYQCTTCGKQYTENRALRYHSQKIHGICLPIKYKYKNSTLHQKGTDKPKEKDFNIGEKKMNSAEKVSSKKAENKQYAKSSLQAMSLSTNNVIVSGHQSQKRKRSLTYTDSHISTGETMKNEQEKRVLNKEMLNNEEINSLQNNTASSTCTLCKQSIRDMRKHLVEYHKIESPDFMLEKLDASLAVLGDHELRRDICDNENKILNEITQEEQRNSIQFQNKSRRKSNVGYTNSKERHKANNDESSQMVENANLQIKKKNKRMCDICLGLYESSSYCRHIRTHRKRGETKENFHLSTKKYFNSPLYRKSKMNLKTNDVFSENTNRNVKDNSNSSKDKEREEHIVQSEHKDKNVPDVFMCSCGRSFRNPYTLFSHKKYCISSKEIKLPITESSVNKSRDCITNSGTGLSITIKKKNNSYEIIDKDNGNGNKLQDIMHSKVVNTSLDTSENNTQIELQGYPHESLELSKYSERHSILKIESANEDIDIDIENYADANFSNDNIFHSTCETVTDFSQEGKEPTIKIEQDDKSYQENINSEFLQETALTKNNSKQSNDIKVNFETKGNICICGCKFYTKLALEIHINKHHSVSKLQCGYCKANFLNAIEWEKHMCSISEGKKFTSLPMEINCHHCNVSSHTYKEFDKHIKHKHFDPLVPFHCFQCHKRFISKTARKIHFCANHKITICPICNNRCLDFMKSRHTAYHYGLGFPCHFCKKSFTRKINLLQHYKAIHKKILHSSKYGLNKFFGGLSVSIKNEV